MIRLDPAQVAQLSGPALRTFFDLAATWRLTEAEQVILLGIADPDTLRTWRAGDTRSFDMHVLERISYLLGIFKAINTLFPDPGLADLWVRRTTAKPFSGRSALDRMLDGGIADFCAVRRYLDAQIGDDP